MARIFLSCFLTFAVACSSGSGRRIGGRDTGPSTEAGACSNGELLCAGSLVEECQNGERVPQVDCATTGQVCAEGQGCVTCSPGQIFCLGAQRRQCDADGTNSTLVEECPAGLACRADGCVNACAEAERNRNNVGCNYMVVDLDNEFDNLTDTSPAQEQFAVVIANTSSQSTEALVYQSNGQPNAPAEALVQTAIVPANSLVQINLPAREVDGSTSTVEGPGTMLTNSAYRIQTSFPVVAYQFNPIIESASNDASLLIPVTALDTRYRILGYPTANPIEIPIGGLDIEGIPDHSYVTIVGTEPATTVRVTLGGDIIAGQRQGGGTIPAARAGETIEYVIGPYDVLNLESDGIPGDMSGTVVEASAPVAVFSGGERALIGAPPLPNHPSGVPDDVCCTEHLEEQVFPTSTWGTNFRVSRSPVRTDHPTWREPDLYRLIADQDGTVVQTTLPAPFNQFTLAENEWVEFHADTSFELTSNLPINVAQYLVSQGWVVSWKPGHGGDPSMIYIPPVEQFRDDYVLLVPETFSTNYVVITAPTGTNIQIDGAPASCPSEAVGDASYDAFFCPLSGGSHRVETDQPVGVLGYGYHSVGSYGYAAGANLERINVI
ncbi:MAG: IgGFc-binding protein [Myxococcota bacterium]